MINNKVNQNDFTVLPQDYNDCMNIKSLFRNYGIIILKDFLCKKLSNSLLESTLDLCREINSKLGLGTDHKSDGNDLNSLDYYVKELESRDRKIVLQAQKIVSKSVGMFSFSNNNAVLDIASMLLERKRNNLLLEGIGGFIPKNTK